MKKIVSVIICFLAFSILLGVGATHVVAENSIPRETNPFVNDYYVEPIDQDAPFFDVVLPKIAASITESNNNSISPYFDELPVANNPENFQSLGSTTYANINGQTVTAEAFYRVPEDSLYDPNCGLGLLVYQCIQYKRAHPEEDVKLTFSSMRTSVTASVCVLPESKYYGYMRSLYGTNYDEHGFVRISYMLSEAARMGIEVTLVTHRDSYSVKQYNPSTGKLKSRANLDQYTYFTKALKSDCYDSYAPGKKVSDFMKYTRVDWTIEDKNIDMVHVKHVSASHYLATDGTEHKNAVFFSGANLDENNYFGGNGNGKTQSGLIVSDHADLYRVTYNYVQLMYKYRHQEEIYELRDLVSKRNTEQIALINSGKGDLIPEDEQIVYIGTANDPVFEMYFAPLGGSMDSWDTVNNPICKYISKLPQSESYVELTWNAYHFNTCYIGTMCENMITKAFCENPNAKNKIYLRIDDFPASEINKLKVGTEIGYRSFKDSARVHTKDVLVSYQENGVRHRVSLMMSAAFGADGLYYRTNSLLVINETDTTGGNFYNIFGKKYSYNMIDDGLKVSPGKVILKSGQTQRLDVFYTGKDTLSYKSSDSSVASAEKGVIYARKPGAAVITVTDGKCESSVVVAVTDAK